MRAVAADARRIGTFIGDGTSSEHLHVRQWYGGLAELAITATLLERFGAQAVKVEPRLPNGRVADAAVQFDNRWLWFEVTALTTSDAAYAAADPRPGVQLWHGDPYLDALRVYRKAFDKIAGVGPRPRSQLHPNEPTILVVADGDVRLGFGSLGFEWAVGQLLDPARRETQSRASLPTWIEHDYPEAVGYATSQLTHLSALAAASYNNRSVELHVSDDADRTHRLTADEIRQINDAFQQVRSWSAEPANP